MIRHGAMSSITHHVNSNMIYQIKWFIYHLKLESLNRRRIKNRYDRVRLKNRDQKMASVGPKVVTKE